MLEAKVKREAYLKKTIQNTIMTPLLSLSSSSNQHPDGGNTIDIALSSHQLQTYQAFTHVATPQLKD